MTNTLEKHPFFFYLHEVIEYVDENMKRRVFLFII